MKLIQCDACHRYFEDEDVQKIEQKLLCYHCVRECKSCNRSFDKGFNSAYCYCCLEGNLV